LLVKRILNVIESHDTKIKILIHFKLRYFIVSVPVGLSENDDILILRSQADGKNTLYDVDTLFLQILYLFLMAAFEKKVETCCNITNSRMSPNLVVIACPFPLLFASFHKAISHVKV
jgi:hypothetical protein